MDQPNKVIATAAIVAVGTGTINSIAKNKQLPSSRFLIGSGVAFLLLSLLAEAEPEIAKALAIAVAITVVIGEGDGVLSYINHRGEMDTAKNQRFTPLSTEGLPPTKAHATGSLTRGYTVTPDGVIIPNMR